MSGVSQDPIYKVAILTSGNGTNMEAVIRYSLETENSPYKVTKVISDRPCKALDRAEKYGIKTLQLHRRAEDFKQELKAALKEVDFIVLAGYLSILDPGLIKAFPNRILNIHPSLLPKYGGMGMYGLNVHEAVLANGETESGCSCHLVTEEVDQGQVLVQKKVKVKADDTAISLRDRILPLEHLCLVEGLLQAILDQKQNDLNHRPAD